MCRYSLSTMLKHGAQVLCFPEFSFIEELRAEIAELSHRVAIVAGSAYANGYNKCHIFADGQEVVVEKIVPSDFEYGGVAKASQGMREGNKIHIVQTRGGKLAVMICRDFIRYGHVLQDYDLDIVVVAAHNVSSEGTRRIRAMASYLTTSMPVYVCVSDSGGHGRSGIWGRLHRSFLSGLTARGIRNPGMSEEEIVVVQEPSMVIASLDVGKKQPIIPAPNSPLPNVFNIEVVDMNVDPDQGPVSRIS